MLPSKVVTYKTHHDTKKKKKPYIKMPSEKKKKAGNKNTCATWL